jgi:elongation factor Ts
MAEIKATDVAKLRTVTGAGMMDCKSALNEANGDFNAAIDILRKKGQKVANKRADREASEGCVLAKTTADGKFGVILALNCETDFVAKNADFVNFTTSIIDLALKVKPANLEALYALPLGTSTVAEEVLNKTGVIGEKTELKYYEVIQAETVTAYIHPGNRLASLAGFNQVVSENIGKDIVMQIAAMSPIAIDKGDISQAAIDKEIEIGKELAINEGKTPEMAEKIALGKLNKFYQESTLLNQEFIKENKKTVRQYLEGVSKGLTVVAFKRFSLSV